MDETQYDLLVKYETNARPDNCQALVIVKCNRNIWDLCSKNVKCAAKRMQHAHNSLIKGSILIAKAVNTTGASRKRGQGERNRHQFGG
ncbi:hypothetical protein DPMN_098846 [Dreissena polymorpha]|uniref:Uncharacterized protein n=1 Tax=Dreissena polymorpha TaxID=45954 RepID=A0A9D4R740_DREPO|nr:hypothetical protein DPMN_098846 [Dreissena polymorpha]